MAATRVPGVLKNVMSMLNDCKVLFCYGPSWEACKKDFGEDQCEVNGLIIYPKCKEDYTPFGCCVCASKCNEGQTDHGLFCKKPKSYGRGVGYVLWGRKWCEDANP